MGNMPCVSERLNVWNLPYSGSVLHRGDISDLVKGKAVAGKVPFQDRRSFIKLGEKGC